MYPLTGETVSAFADAEAPTVAGEVFVAIYAADAPERGAAVAPVRTNDGLSALVTTVDDLDLVAGRVATVIALQDLERGVVGHYGYGDGATSSLPPPPGERPRRRSRRRRKESPSRAARAPDCGR